MFPTVELLPAQQALIYTSSSFLRKSSGRIFEGADGA